MLTRQVVVALVLALDLPGLLLLAFDGKRNCLEPVLMVETVNPL